MTPTPGKINAVSIEANPEFIEALRHLQIEGLQISDPVPTSSVADILESPMTGEDIRQVLQLVTLFITTTEAGLKLTELVIRTIQGLRPAPIAVRDAVTGEHRGDISEASSRDDVARVFQR